MNAIELLREADGGAGISALSQQFGLTTDQVEAVIAGVAPHMIARIERNTLSRGGVADLVALLGAAQAGGLGNSHEIGSDLGRHQGNALLEQVFGTRDQSRAVAARASYASGIGDGIIKAMLPYIASMVIKAIVNRTSGGLGDIIARLPKSGRSSPAPRAPAGGGIEDILGRIPNIGVSGATPPQPAPGGTGSMLPGPDGMNRGGPASNPYGDLSDIIRRGGSGTQVDGSPLWRIVRNALGGALGFQSRGIMSWIFRMVILRFGWRMLTSMLRRVVLGR